MRKATTGTLRSLLPVLLLLTVACSVPPRGGAELPAASPAGRPFTLAPYFACQIPADWSVESGDHGYGLSPEEKKVFGITLQAPRAGVLPVTVSVLFYAAGNLLHDSPETYIRRHAQPIFVAKEGDEYGPVTVAVVGKQKTWVFERQKNEFVPAVPLDGIQSPADDPRVYARPSVMARPVPVRERFAVIPAAAGFYALRYSAPAEQFAQFLAAFEQVATTFHPLQ